MTVQGNCSYSVYAGPEHEFFVQFRLKSLMLRLETVALAREIYGEGVPKVEFYGEVGDGGKGLEMVFVCVMERIRGISYLDFILASDVPGDEKRDFIWRKRLMSDVARYGSSVFLYSGGYFGYVN